MMDVAVDGLWTHLDGSSIVNNDFISTFSTNQPNGGESQNCVVINSKSHSFSNKTQDKQCTTYRKNDMLCYKKGRLILFVLNFPLEMLFFYLSSYLCEKPS